MPAGRPSEYTQEKAIAICERIADGESLRSICASEDMPSRPTVFRWIGNNEEFRNQYEKARQEQADLLAEEILEIADDGRNDFIETNDPENPGYRTNGEAIARSRLRVDARKWMAGKLRPKVYGDKVVNELTGKDGGPIETKNMTDTELARWIAFNLRKGIEEAE